MKRIFSIFVATLLLSTTLWANNVAKVGTADYDDIAKAIAAWTTDGGTLQLLDNCEYSATATIAKASILDLNGKTLTWKINSQISAITISGGSLTIKDDTKTGKLSFLFTNMQGIPTNGIIYADSKGTAESFTVENATLAFDVQAASTYKPNGMNVKAIFIKKGNVSMTNSTLLTKNNAAYALYLDCSSASVRLEKFENNTVRYEGCTAEKLFASEIKGVHIAKIDADNDVVFNNCTIDMSNVPVQYDKYSNKKWSTQNTTIYALHAYGSSNNKSNVTIVGGEYKTPTNSASANVCAVKQSTYMTITINSGKFVGTRTVVPAVGGIEGGSFIPCPSSQYAKSGYHFTKQSDGYYALEAGEPLFTINEEGFTDVNELKKYTDGKATVMLFTTNTFTIPAEANIKLSVKDVKTAYSVVNKGTVYIGSGTTVFNGTFINDGTLNLTTNCSNGEFTNNGTAAIYSSGTCKSITNSGTLNIGGNGNSHSAGDFTASMLVNTGTLTVSAGTYTAQQYNSLIKDNIATGYRGWALDATKQKYKVASLTNFKFEVDGVAYSNITGALKACTEATPVILWQDYTAGCTISDGKDYYVNLNGKTWKVPAKAGSLQITHGGLTISGTGEIICSASGSISLKGSDTESNYTRFTIGEGVTLTNGTYVNKYILMLNEAPYCGVVVNFNGKMVANANANDKWCHGFYVNGDQSSTVNAPIFNIGEKAEITIEKGIGAYAAGYAKWNFAGKMVADTCGIELRAGEFTMNGGSIGVTMNKPADDQFNGSGSTSQACAIAACQHSTKLPISVIINGGSLKAYTPIYQANPQNNPQEAIDKVSVTVNNAQVFSTSKNIVWSANKKVVLNGGIYNLSPAAYVAESKAVVANTDAATKDMYPYTIGEKAADVATAKAGNWNDAATWTGGAVPTAATPVIVKHAVVIPADVKAEVAGIDVQNNAVLTVEGTLVAGNEGIKGITNANQLLIKDGGAMVISPAATNANQPLGTVYKTLNTYKKTVPVGEGESPYVRQHIGIPTTTLPAKNQSVYVSVWNTANGWENATEFATPFKGYDITTEAKPAESVSFAGTLVGAQDATLSMPRNGFHFFGNSWSAPLDSRELMNQLDALKQEGKVEASIKLHNSDDRYTDITRQALTFDASLATIAPMTGFFLFAKEATAVTLNYEKAVWNVAVAAKTSAPQRVSDDSENMNSVRITLRSASGKKDNVLIYDGENFHSTKMMNDVPNVNIFVVDNDKEYSTYASENLEGTVIAIQTNSETNYSLSFDWLRGETLYIKDLQTNAVTAMKADNVYTFTATAKETSRRFMVTYGTPSAIDNAVVNTAVKGVYSVTGQYLGTHSVLETLPQGIYIVDGQKYSK